MDEVITRSCCYTSVKNIFVWAEWLRQSGRAPSEPSETPRWRTSPLLASIPCIAFHIAFQSPLRRFFSLCRSPIYTNTLTLWPTVTIHRNGFIGCTLASGLLCDGLHYEHLSSSSFYIELEERRKMVRRYDTTQPWGSTISRNERVRPSIGKDRVCIFVVWQDEMKMTGCRSTPGFSEYIIQVTHSTSISPVSPYTHCRSLTIYLEAVIELDWRGTWRLRLSKPSDALGGRDQSSLEMNCEAMIERVCRCTWRLRWSELRDALGGRDRATLVIDLEAAIEWTHRCTLRLWPTEFADVLAVYDRVRLEEYLEAFDWEGGGTATETLFIG